MKKRVIAIILALCLILPIMLVHSYAEESSDVTISEEVVETEDTAGDSATESDEVKEDKFDILDLFEDELIEDENEKRILNTMFFVFVLVIIVRLLLLFAGVV